jgi:diguanylate cyclase
MFGELFLTHGEIAASHCLQYRHNALLVALSYLVAAFAAYTAFHLIERVRDARIVKDRQVWLAVAGISMGLGIWAMHFIAMLAVQMPIPISYDLQTTVLSAGFAIFRAL